MGVHPSIFLTLQLTHALNACPRPENVERKIIIMDTYTNTHEKPRVMHASNTMLTRCCLER